MPTFRSCKGRNNVLRVRVQSLEFWRGGDDRRVRKKDEGIRQGAFGDE